MLLVGGSIAVVVLAFAVPLALLVRNVVYRDATNQLQDQANRIANYLRSSYSQVTDADLTSFLGTLDGDGAASVQLADGTVIGTLPPGNQAVYRPFTPDHRGGGGADDDQQPRLPDQPTPEAFEGGKLVTLPVFGAPGDRSILTVRTWASDAQLRSGEKPWWLLLGLSSLGLLAAGLVAAELLTRRLVRPLVQTAETAHRMSAGDVTARAPTQGPPEIAEVGVALNRLGDRIDQLIAEERETVADLSHRLRTPLTALRLDAEARKDPVEAERVGTHVTALERMLTAVIHAARRPQREGRLPVCDATEVVGARVQFWSALADDQNRRRSVALPPGPLPVRAGAEDLAAAVDALVENVIAHTPESTAFSVALHGEPGGARLVISDDGPGIPADAVVRGRSDRGSSGLGLDIARRCAESAGGSMTIGRSPSGGAEITLLLRAP